MAPKPPVRVELTREELYDQAWTEPLSRLAPRYGISNVGLRKICVKHDIPVPSRGYWAKVRAGHKPKRVRLPKRPDARPIVIVATRSPGFAPSKSEHLQERVAYEALPGNKIQVKNQLRGLHPVAKDVLKALRSSKLNQHGLRECTGESLVHVRVTPENVKRAALIVDALVRAALKRGCELRGPTGDGFYSKKRQASLLIEGEAVTFYLAEQLLRTDHVPTPEEIKSQEAFSWDRPRKYDHLPSGLLRLELRMFGWSSRGKTWKESESRRLEDRLNDVMVGLFEYLERKRIESERRAEEVRIQQEERQRIEAIRQEREREVARVKQLWSDAEAWAKAERLRAYVAATKERAAQADPGVDLEEIRRWSSWALAQADDVDPISRRIPSRLPLRIVAQDEDA